MAALGKALPDARRRALLRQLERLRALLGRRRRSRERAVRDRGRRLGRAPGIDGPDCLSAGIHNLANNPIELVENEFPLRVLQYGLRQDSGGAGRSAAGRGRAHLRAARRLRALGAVRPGQVPAARAPRGCSGRERGSSSSAAALGSELRGQVDRCAVARGDRVTVLTQGGGGLGDPAERDAGAIARDSRAGR